MVTIITGEKREHSLFRVYNDAAPHYSNCNRAAGEANRDRPPNPGRGTGHDNAFNRSLGHLHALSLIRR